jgi:sugar lactone lactonase YvrE
VPQTFVLTDAKTNATESPLWDVREQRLYWAGHLDGLLFSSAADGTDVRVWRFPGLLTAFALREAGGAIVCSGTRIFLFDLDTNEAVEALDVGGAPAMNLNDGKVDRDGRFVIGLTDLELLVKTRQGDAEAQASPRGGYYRIDKAMALSPVTTGIAVSNGPCFSPDGGTFYCGDSLAQRIYEVEYAGDAGSQSPRGVLATFTGDGEEGRPIMPDGATVDADGHIWVAAVNGGEIRRYAPDGRLARRITFPVPRPTSVAFGGIDMNILYVTSMAGEGIGEDKQATPLAGSLFAIHGLGVRGIPERRFAA